MMSDPIDDLLQDVDKAVARAKDQREKLAKMLAEMSADELAQWAAEQLSKEKT